MAGTVHFRDYPGCSFQEELKGSELSVCTCNIEALLDEVQQHPHFARKGTMESLTIQQN